MPFGTEVGLSLGDIVLDGDPAPPKRGTAPKFLAHVCCGQMAGCINMPLGTDVGLGPRHIHCVRWGPGFPRTERGTAAPPFFGPCLLWPNGWPSQQVLSSCYIMYRAFLGNS